MEDWRRLESYLSRSSYSVRVPTLTLREVYLA